MTYKTDQEKFWAGDFGNEYIGRNQGPELLASNLALFSRALASAEKPSSCIEFGANIGMNLRALKLLYPRQEQHAIEINENAARQLIEALPDTCVINYSILDFSPTRQWDLVLIKGVLIHINPDELFRVYEALYRSSIRHILICEYYNPSPVVVEYRGHKDRLFKRDFCGEMLKAYPDLKLRDYGFCYHKDPSFPQDDVTWFLLEKATAGGAIR